MLRNKKVAVAAMVVALSSSTIGVTGVGAEPSMENELCRTESVRRWMTWKIFGEEVNHGRCLGYFQNGYDPNGEKGGCSVIYYDDGTYGIQCFSG